MTVCTIPPAGWSCSRIAGHEGPCAARQIAPYDDYVDRMMGRCLQGGLVFEDGWAEMNISELRSLLADAWLNGLAYSLELMPKEKNDGQNSTQPNTMQEM